MPEQQSSPPHPAALPLISGLILVLMLCAAIPLASWSTGWVHLEGLYASAILVPLLLLYYLWARRAQVSLRLPLGSFLLLLALAWAYNLIANIAHLAYPDLLVSNLLMTMGCLALLWGLLRTWSLLYWLPVLFIGMLEIFIYLQYGSTINSLIIAEVLETSPDDAKAYITPKGILATCLILALLPLIGVITRLILKRRTRPELIFHGLLLGTLSCLISLLPQEQNAGRWPLDESIKLGLATHEAISHNIATIREVQRLPSPSLKASSLPLFQGDEGIVLVVHIGESLLANRMSLNGYKRKTTPYLDSNPRLINFPHCIAAASETSQAHITILTNARRSIKHPDSAMRASTGSVFDLFVAQGFKLYSFFGRKVTQQLKHDRVMKLLSRGASKQYYNQGLFAESSTHLKAHLDEIDKSPDAQQNQLLFICNEGSHTPFNHYDKDNPPFTPTIDSFNDPQAQSIAINNAYDNTVHYTDSFIHTLLQHLAGRPYLYLYISDHGELLGENGIWGRGALGDREDLYLKSSACHIGMFVIASPELEVLHPHLSQSLAQLRQNRHLIVSHEHIFHTLLGIMKLQSPYYEQKLDLASPHVTPYSGEHPLKTKSL